MATFYNLAEYPNESIKSKLTGEFLSIPERPSNLLVPNEWDVKSGDVISWSDYRATETYFVTTDNRLQKTPDTSAAGYLTIPLSITSFYPDAIQHYSSVLDEIGCINVASIELLPTDQFFSSHFSHRTLSEEICQRKDISYSYDPNEEVLTVTYHSTPTIHQYFPLNSTTTDEIVQWILCLGQPRTAWIVNYHFRGAQLLKTIANSHINGLPAGWQCEQYGSASAGADFKKGQWKCHGPETNKVEARKAIEKFYQDASIEFTPDFLSIEEHN